MKFEAITIKDIAKALALSTSTVSRALRDSYEISPETKSRVIAYAREHNYHPNPVALGLKERKTFSIGVMVSQIANSFFSQTINGIESVANEKRYDIIISQSHDQGDREIRNLQYLTSRSIDGLIVSVANQTRENAYFAELHARGLPIVFFDRIVETINTHKVIVDNYKGSFEATLYLISKGYRNIHALCYSESLSISRERIAGYKDAMNEKGIGFSEKNIRVIPQGKTMQSDTHRALQSLFNRKQPPDAIFSASDSLTMAALKSLQRLALRIPDDVALLGYSNIEISDLLCPPLSVIRQPAFEMGATATELLLQLIESRRPVTEFETRVLNTEMILRDSVKK